MLDTQNAHFVLSNPFKDSNSNLLFLTIVEGYNDNHVGHIYISDNNTGMILYCCTQHLVRIVQIIQD